MDPNQDQNRPSQNYNLPSDQQVYGTPRQQPPNKFKQMMIIAVALIILLLLIVSIAAAISKSGKKSGGSKSNSSSNTFSNEHVDVPDDWESIDSQYGYSVMAPADWERGAENTSTDNNIETKRAVIATSTEDNSGDAELAPTSSQPQIVTIGTSKLSSGGDQNAFDNALEPTYNSTKYLADTFGVDVSKVKETKYKATINDKDFSVIDDELPDQLSRTYYLWHNEHAVAISLVQTDSDKTKFEDYANKYFKPILASIKFDDDNN